MTAQDSRPEGFSVTTWHIYKMSDLSLNGWWSFGLHRSPQEQLSPSPDFIGDFARAVNLLSQCVPNEWWYGYNEYWMLELPMAAPMVCIRREKNPFHAGYLVSPIPLPHIKSDQHWEIESV